VISVEPTRQIFGNIPFWSQALFYVLTVATMGMFVYGVWRRFRLWRQGTPVDAMALFKGNLAQLAQKWKPGARRVLVDALGQQRVKGRGAAGRAHIILFAGFMMLFLGTTMLEIDHIAEMISASLAFHRGLYYVIYEYTLDVFGLLFLAGCGYFLWRRTRRPASVGHRATDWYVLGSLIAIGLTGYLVEALRIGWQHPVGIGAKCSPVGLWIFSNCFAGLSDPALRSAHLGVWWLHSLLVFGFIASIPFTRLFHFIAGPLNLFFARHTLGVLRPITMEEVEQTERMGVSDIRHFTQQQLLSLDACMECGRCEDVCPATATAKPLSPKKVVVALRDLMTETLGSRQVPETPRALHGETIAAETLWSCTACSACVNICPVRIDQLTLILDLRRHLVGEGGLSGAAATALRRVQSAGNPWGLPAAERADWIQALNPPPDGKTPPSA
jgi:heterodisulfide reductase subunit C/nitrate reductase gamma subunit